MGQFSFTEDMFDRNGNTVNSTAKDDRISAPEFCKSVFMGSETGSVAESGGMPDSRPTKISLPENQMNEVFGGPPALPGNIISKIEAIVEAGGAVRRLLSEALPKPKGGLYALYRTLELPDTNLLKDAHAVPDAAVLTACGSHAEKNLLAQHLLLNQQVADRTKKGEPVAAPGVPKNYPKPEKLATEPERFNWPTKHTNHTNQNDDKKV